MNSTRKSSYLLFFLVIFLLARSADAQVQFPKPVGHVNDFANILNKATEQNLESRLREYRDKTSIEIAVVTVDSLEDLDVQDYTVSLAEKWGIGDKRKDNGIVFLVAPNEREMFIATGYGMEPDLTDAQAGRIINSVIIPYFKESVEAVDPVIKAQKMADGITAGVKAMISELGDTPYQARLEERKIAEEKRRVEEQRRAEEAKTFLTFAGIFLAGLMIIGTPIVIVYRKVKRNRELQAQFKSNFEALDRCRNLVGVAAEDEYPEAQRSLDELKRETPKDVWAQFDDSVSKFMTNLGSYQREIDELTVKNQTDGWKKSEDTLASISSLEVNILGLVKLPVLIRSVSREFGRARSQSPALLENTLHDIETAKQKLSHKDVSERARQYLKDAESECEEARLMMNGKELVNWLAISGVIATAITLVATAVRTANSDMAEAEEARRPKPVDRPTHRSSSSGYRSSRSSGGGSGFGGFGGGRFGGGGARGKW